MIISVANHVALRHIIAFANHVARDDIVGIKIISLANRVALYTSIHDTQGGVRCSNRRAAEDIQNGMLIVEVRLSKATRNEVAGVERQSGNVNERPDDVEVRMKSAIR